MSRYITLGSTFILCSKSYNQTRLGLKFQIKRNPYTKRILITKENIKLSPITDRDTTTNQSATSTLSSRVMGRLPVTAIGKHWHWSSARICHHFRTWSYLVVSPSATTFIGNFLADWSPLLHLPIHIPLTLDAYRKIRVQKWCKHMPPNFGV